MLHKKVIFLLFLKSIFYDLPLYSSEGDYSTKLTEKDRIIFNKTIGQKNFEQLFEQYSELGLKRLLECAQAKDITKECWHHIIRNYHLHEDPEHNLLKEKVDIIMDDERCLAYYADSKNRMALPKEYLQQFRRVFSSEKALQDWAFIQGSSPSDFNLPSYYNYNEKTFSEECKLLASFKFYNKDFFALLQKDVSQYTLVKQNVLDLYKRLKVTVTKNLVKKYFYKNELSNADQILEKVGIKINTRMFLEMRNIACIFFKISKIK